MAAHLPCNLSINADRAYTNVLFNDPDVNAVIDSVVDDADVDDTQKEEKNGCSRAQY